MGISIERYNLCQEVCGYSGGQRKYPVRRQCAVEENARKPYGKAVYCADK